jgi:hypothetical protein
MRATPRVRFSTRLSIGLTSALLSVCVAAVGIVPASTGPTASVAKKKKCSKKKRKKGKCGKAGDPVALLTALFAGSSFSSTFEDPSPSVDGTATDVFKFCRNGTYSRRDQSTGTIRSGLGPIPYDHVTTYGGTWKITVLSGEGLRKNGDLKGGLDITITSWQDSDGAPQPVTQDSFTVTTPADRRFFIIGDHPAWTRTPGGAGC